MSSRGTLVFRGGRFWGVLLYSIPMYVTRSVTTSFSYISNKIFSFSESVSKSKNSLSNMKDSFYKMKNKSKKVKNYTKRSLNITKKNV
jgi:hypothetical protein